MSLSPAHTLAAALRVPVFARDTPPRQRVDAMEEFMLVSAFHGGELHQERLEVYAKLEPLKRRWESIQGWETFARGKTDEARTEAKRGLQPDLHAEMAELSWTLRRLSEEIDRLERDANKVSRAYTMLSGA